MNMPRPAFTVVSSSVAALVLLGFISTYLKPKIPVRAENQLGGDGVDFLARASTQRVDWKEPVLDSFSTARRRDLPILLFIGSTDNPLARGIDEGIQLSPRIQTYLSRNFVCIRVDLQAFPAFRNAFLPLSRAYINFDPGCQLWVLDPAGHLIDLVPQSLGSKPSDENAFLSAFVDALRKFDSPTKQPFQDRYQEAQLRDLALLQEGQTQASPDFNAFTNSLESMVSTQGGFGNSGPRTLMPEAWRYLLVTGHTESFKQSVDPVISSPVVDLVDGGFFYGSANSSWFAVEYGKSAVSNAAMLRLLAQSYRLTHNEVHRYLAQRTFDALVGEFLGPVGFLSDRRSDAQVDRRSNRASFGVRRMREILSDSERPWAQQNLGLRVEANPQMTPHLPGADNLPDQIRLDSILQKLKEAGKELECEGAGYEDVTGLVVARLIESARILGDHKRLETAVDLFPWVESPRAGTGISHSSLNDQLPSYLGDYLAYSDAALQYFLATGRYDALESGRSVLGAALSMFGQSRTGFLNLATAPKSPLPASLSTPEICDWKAESTNAMAIRLCQDYWRLFPTERRFREFVNGSTSGLAGLAQAIGLHGAGFFSAAQSVFDDAFFVTVGPEAQQLAATLATLQPVRLVVPAFGDIRSDVSQRGKGVYLLSGSQIRGPFSVDQAAKMVPATIGFGA
jgi:uncharacterized protein YyaL (SSP411 family)